MLLVLPTKAVNRRAVVFLVIIASGTQSVSISLAVVAKLVRLVIISRATEINNALLMQQIHEVINIIRVDCHIVIINTVLGRAVKLQSSDGEQKQTLFGEGDGGVHT